MVGPAAKLPTQPGLITISEDERKSGKLSDKTIMNAMELLHRDGLLSLLGVVDPAHLVKIRENMLETAKTIMASKTSASHFNHGLRTNFLQSPPLTNKDLLFTDIYANTFVHQILQAYLGPLPRHAFITANNALANTTQRQPVHKDTNFLHPTAPYMVNVNFQLSEFTPENGSTEFWLGTHTTDSSCQIWPTKDSTSPMCDVSAAALSERSKVRAGEQIRVPFGAITFRDMRTWHAGMPNQTDEDRIMLALAYVASWYPKHSLPFKVPETAREILNSSPLVTTYFDYLPDEKWLELSQTWGAEVPETDKIVLPPTPGMGDKMMDEGYETLNQTRTEDKVLLEKGKTVPAYR